MRIVSLLPSATEIICSLGLRSSLVGVTHECDFPEDVKSLPRVTRSSIPHDASSNEIDSLVREHLETENALYALNLEVLQSVKPDLIVTQALCDVCAVAESEVQAAACSLPGQPQVVNLEPNCLADVLQCIQRVGDVTQQEQRAIAFVAELNRRIKRVQDRSDTLQRQPTVMLLEWIDPPFSAGHWTPELISIAGGREAIGVAGKRSETTSWETIVESDPEALVIACCGFDVKRTLEDVPILESKHEWSKMQCVKNQRVYVVDGSAYFNRPGPRLVDSLEILANALHPDLHPLPDHLSPALKLL